MKDSKNNILRFWFTESMPAQWFQKNPEFDALIRDRFLSDYELAAAGIFDGWVQDGAEGCLALCILLDQFPRNMFRGSPLAFATDDQALEVAGHAVLKRYDALLPVQKRRFLYLPFEHAEDPGMQEKSVALFAAMKDEDPVGYDYALRHREIIARFGRFPHRNAALGRASTEAEKEFLATDPGF